MAIVQISRIQVRRGRKNDGIIPQLASGELGWAIDEQELYIGSGSVSEGAPQVENVQILTAKDDLLTLARQYAYKRGEVQTGADAGTPIERTLQNKLDDIVSVRDFGAEGNGEDQTNAIQRAVDQLYISSSKGLYKSRVTLYFPAGEYFISRPIYIPPFANIKGDGKGKTFINATGAHAFKTVNELSIPGTPGASVDTTANNMARSILIEGMTIEHTGFGGTLYLENCRESLFKDIEFIAGWSTNLTGLSDGIDLGTTSADLQSATYVPNNNLTAIVLSNGSISAASTDKNRFINIDYNGYAVGVYSHHDIEYNIFDQGTVYDCGFGFLLGADNSVAQPVGATEGAHHNIISKHVFELVGRQGIWVRQGQFNTSENNRFLNVGNEGGNEQNGAWSCIEFKRTNNTSQNDFFERTNERTVGLTIDPSIGTYWPEVGGPKSVELNFQSQASVGVKLTSTPFLYLCADKDRGTIEVEYQYTAEISPGPCNRKGVMTIVYNKDNAEVSLSDDYIYTGNASKATNMTFTAQSSITNNKVVVECVNTTLDSLSPEVDELTYTIKYIA